MKFFDDFFGVTALRQTNNELTDKLKAANDFIYQTSKDKTQLVTEKLDLQHQLKLTEELSAAQIEKLKSDLSVSNGAIESLKTALATSETEIPTAPPVFVEPKLSAYLPNVQIVKTDGAVENITVINPSDIYSRSDLLNNSLGVSAARKLPKYQKLMKVWNFVTSSLAYYNDFQDNWQYHGITILRKKGDCEDGTVLFVDCARAVGISSTDVFNAVGNTNFGYHSYPIVFFTDDELKGTPCEQTGMGFYIFESTLDFLPGSPRKLNGSPYYCEGGLANWKYQGRIKQTCASLFNGINMPTTGAGFGIHEERIEHGEQKKKAIREYWAKE